MCDEEFDEMEDILVLDEDTDKVWGGIFDIATPQETANMFDKPVYYKGERYDNK